MRPMLLSLADMLVCRTISRMLHVLLQKTLELMEGVGLSGFDQYFWNSNLDPIWDLYLILMSVSLPSDRSGLRLFFQIWSCLCPEHYHEDERRCHLNPNIHPLSTQSISSRDFREGPWNHFAQKPEIKQTLLFPSLWASNLRKREYVYIWLIHL